MGGGTGLACTGSVALKAVCYLAGDTCAGRVLEHRGITGRACVRICAHSTICRTSCTHGWVSRVREPGILTGHTFGVVPCAVFTVVHCTGRARIGILGESGFARCAMGLAHAGDA